MNPDFVMQVNEAAEIIYDLVDPSANLIFGAVVDKNLQQEVGVESQRLTVRKPHLSDHHALKFLGTSQRWIGFFSSRFHTMG